MQPALRRFPCLAFALCACGPPALGEGSGGEESGSEATSAGADETDPSTGDGDGDGDPAQGDGDGDEVPGDGDGDGDGACIESIITLGYYADLEHTAYPCLVEVTGDLTVADNTTLSDLSELLPALERVGGELRIENNTNFSSLGVELDSVGAVYIYDNPDLLEFDGLAGITSTGRFVVSSSPGLTSIEGFAGLVSVDDDVALSGAPFIDSLAPLGALESAMSISLSNLDGLVDLEGLGSLASLQQLRITSLDALGSFAGLGPVAFGPVPRLDLRDNPSLASLADFSATSPGVSSCELVLKDLPLLDSLAPLAGFCAGASLDLVLQELMITTLEGLEPGPDNERLTLSRNPELVDLGAFATVVHADMLQIGSYCPGDPASPGSNDALTTLAGLEQLDSTGQLDIHGNASLVDITAVIGVQVEMWGDVSQNPMLPPEQVADFVAQAGGNINTAPPEGLCPQ